MATCYLHLQGRIFFYPEDEGRRLPLKVGMFLLNYAASLHQEHLGPKFQGIPFNLRAAHIINIGTSYFNSYFISASEYQWPYASATSF
jgi:hypothetical protein